MNKRKTISDSNKYFVLSRDGFTCQYCGRSAPEVILHVDHILPVARGGDNSLTNLISSCDSCNYGKGTTLLPDELIQEKRADILTRTKMYNNYLSSVPGISREIKEEHLIKRPTRTLNKYPFVVEPLKDRAIHADKRHLLEVHISKKISMEIEYHRFFQGNWESVPIKNKILNPITKENLDKIMHGIIFELHEEIYEYDKNIFVHRSDNGFWLIQVEEGAYNYYYTLWVPAKNLELHIAFDEEWLDDNTMTEDSFFGFR